MRVPNFPDTPRASRVELKDDELRVYLLDSRTLTVPLAWFPRLLHGSETDRQNFRLLGSGLGIHWPTLDEDLSVSGLLRGASPPKKIRSIKPSSNIPAR
ncbi:MAG: DUF2442 domain-containing protein [Acidobacteriota bacterium]